MRYVSSRRGNLLGKSCRSSYRAEGEHKPFAEIERRKRSSRVRNNLPHPFFLALSPPPSLRISKWPTNPPPLLLNAILQNKNKYVSVRVCSGYKPAHRPVVTKSSGTK